MFFFLFLFFFLVIIILLAIVSSVSFLVTVICPPSCFFMKFSSHRIDASTLSSMLASLLPPPFLDIYSRLTSSLECSALFMLISFLILWSICLSSSLIHFTKGPEYLTRGTAQVFIPLIRFLLDSFVSNSFQILGYSFLIFSFISTCLIVSVSKMPKYL